MKTILVAVFSAVLALHGFGQTPAPRRHSLSLEAQSVANGGAALVSSDSHSHTINAPLLAPTAEGASSVTATVRTLNDRQDLSNRTNLQMRIHNFSTVPDSVTLEWYFVTSAVAITTRQFGSTDFVFDHGSQVVPVAPGITESYMVTSKSAQSVIMRSTTGVSSGDPSVDVTFRGGSSSAGYKMQHGLIMRGWFVRLTDNGQVVATRGSSQTYEDLAKDDAKINALLGQQPGAGNP